MESRTMQQEMNQLYALLPPHFLLNTMNNLYALSLEDEARTQKGIAKITDGIVKISELLRSVLYECNTPRIPLEKEIEIIQNYIDLERLRFEGNFHVSFIYSGLCDKLSIAPLILFTFVENCFKHCTRKSHDEDAIQIKLHATGKCIYFQTKNLIAPDNSMQRVSRNGIGLENVKKRLEGNYQGNYRLVIKEEPTFYCVDLKISSVRSTEIHSLSSITHI